MKKKLEHKIKLKINEINVLLSKNNIKCWLELKDFTMFTVDNKCMSYELFIYIENNLYSIDNVNYFKNFLLKYSSIEFLSNIQKIIGECDDQLSLIEDTFKAIKLNKQLDEEILTSNEVKTKRKI